MERQTNQKGGNGMMARIKQKADKKTMKEVSDHISKKLKNLGTSLKQICKEEGIDHIRCEI